MRKSTLFLSAVLTTFMLAIMAGAVSAYQKSVKSMDTSGKEEVAAVDLNSTETATASPAAAITPEQAAALAAQVMGNTDLYSVETTDFNGASVYLVTFSSGDLVYVSPEGQILSIGSIPPVVVSAPASQNGGGGGGGGSRGGEHESDHSDDHEEHDD
jgi:uncharacterized protein YpmB